MAWAHLSGFQSASPSQGRGTQRWAWLPFPEIDKSGRCISLSADKGVMTLRVTCLMLKMEKEEPDVFKWFQFHVVQFCTVKGFRHCFIKMVHSSFILYLWWMIINIAYRIFFLLVNMNSPTSGLLAFKPFSCFWSSDYVTDEKKDKISKT